MNTQPHEAVIEGAGPTGLRITIQPRTLELFEQGGCVEQFCRPRFGQQASVPS